MLLKKSYIKISKFVLLSSLLTPSLHALSFDLGSSTFNTGSGDTAFSSLAGDGNLGAANLSLTGAYAGWASADGALAFSLFNEVPTGINSAPAYDMSVLLSTSTTMNLRFNLSGEGLGFIAVAGDVTSLTVNQPAGTVDISCNLVDPIQSNSDTDGNINSSFQLIMGNDSKTEYQYGGTLFTANVFGPDFGEIQSVSPEGAMGIYINGGPGNTDTAIIQAYAPQDQVINNLGITSASDFVAIVDDNDGVFEVVDLITDTQDVTDSANFTWITEDGTETNYFFVEMQNSDWSEHNIAIAVPEPSEYALFFGITGLCFVAYRRRKK